MNKRLIMSVSEEPVTKKRPHVNGYHSDGNQSEKTQYFNHNSNQNNFVIEAVGQTELEKFDSIFETLVNDLTKDGLNNEEIREIILRFKEVIHYNVPHGKKNRGLAVICSYRHLASPDQCTDDNLNRARVLGWCIEMLQAFFLVADDIMDQSSMRRGQPCWYKVNNVGNIAINDSYYLEAIIYQVLKQYFRSEPYYLDILELFHQTTIQTVIGQGLDLTTPPADGSIDLSRFSLKRYDSIVKWKTAYYSFYMPVALAMYMAGVTSKQSFENAKTILLQMGHYFQVQDDYLDCYGDPSVTGKVGTDIEENKCGWLINQALLKATPEQIQILQENYGQDNSEKVAKVKAVFNELDLKSVYLQYEEDSYNELMSLIDKTSQDLPKQLFIDFANKIYKRKK